MGHNDGVCRGRNEHFFLGTLKILNGGGSAAESSRNDYSRAGKGDIAVTGLTNEGGKKEAIKKKVGNFPVG